MSEIRVENIIGETGTDAVKFTKGINATGIVTATSFSGALAASQLTGALPAISGAALTGVSAGKILQVVSTVKSDVFSTTSQTFTDITGLSATITPANSNNKVFVMAVIGSVSNDDAAYVALTYGNNTAIIQGDSASGKISCNCPGVISPLSERLVSKAVIPPVLSISVISPAVKPSPVPMFTETFPPAPPAPPEPPAPPAVVTSPVVTTVSPTSTSPPERVVSPVVTSPP